MFELGEDKPKEECGVLGIYAPTQEVARLTYYGLYALQHRGQESAGIAVSDGLSINVHKGMGLVSEVFSDSVVDCLKGKMAIGHVRYSPTGSGLPANAQPLVVHYQKGMMALAHNGSITNALELREELGKNGAVFQTTIDSEVIINLITRYRQKSLEDSLVKTMRDLRGAYALVILAEDKVIGLRDPHGVRPLCIGRMREGYCLASESCVLDITGAEFVRDVAPGEIVVIDEEGLHSYRGYSKLERRSCAFEYIHIARPDSTIDQLSVSESRRRMGVELAREYPLDVDLVIAVPDSGTASALGYATTLGIPFGDGIIKNRYIHRTFIRPTHEMREVDVQLKLNANASVLKNKRIVIIDDSIIQGTTSSKLVEMVRNAGAKEVHFLISSPPVAFPCFYGIDTVKPEKLIANQLDIEGIREFVGADSLHYISKEGLLRALGRDCVCLACFDGVYPIPI